MFEEKDYQFEELDDTEYDSDEAGCCFDEFDPSDLDNQQSDELEPDLGLAAAEDLLPGDGRGDKQTEVDATRPGDSELVRSGARERAAENVAQMRDADPVKLKEFWRTLNEGDRRAPGILEDAANGANMILKHIHDKEPLSADTVKKLTESFERAYNKKGDDGVAALLNELMKKLGNADVRYKGCATGYEIWVGSEKPVTISYLPADRTRR